MQSLRSITGSLVLMKTPPSYIVTTDRQRIRAACLINAAGLYADEVAALALHTKSIPSARFGASITKWSPRRKKA